jgi:hypothetical protein
VEVAPPTRHHFCSISLPPRRPWLFGKSRAGTIQQDIFPPEFAPIAAMRVVQANLVCAA